MIKKKGKIIFIISLVAVCMLGLFISLLKQDKLFAVEQIMEKWGWVGLSETAGSGGISLISFNNASTSTGYTLRIETDPSSCTGAGNNECPVEGVAWLGSYENDGGPGNPIGPLQFFSSSDLASINKPTYVDTSPYWDLNTKKFHGWARLYSIYEEGSVAGNNYDWGWVKLNGDIDPVGDYNVYYDPGTNRMSGWAWSGNGTSNGTTVLNGTGLGWLQFDLVFSDLASIPYLVVEQGDVYSGQDIIGDQDLAIESNATYLVLANRDIEYFASDQGYLEDLFPDTLDLPTESTGDIFRSNVGDIDIGGLSTQSNGTKNKYGNEVVIDSFPPAGALDNTVYVQNSSLSLGDTEIKYDGTNFGNGTIIVNGDLNINGDITYPSTTYLNNINLLPSVAWIVLGDINIDPSVNYLSGVFIALDENPSVGEGVINTGSGSVPLVVSGAMIAYKFNFERDAIEEAGDPVPSEKIIYDGRLIANSPPGLQDFAKTLPELSQTTPN